MSECFSFTKKEAKEIDLLWEKAEADASKDEAALANILRSKISWRYVKSSLCLGEFSSLLGRRKNNEKLYNDILDSGAKTFRESIGKDGSVVPFPIYRVLPADQWFSTNGFARVLYPIVWAIYGVALALAAVIFVLAIRSKKYAYCSILPLFGGLIEIALWSRRAFLAWVDIDEYAITLAVMIITVGFSAFMLERLKTDKIGKRIGITLVCMLLFALLYEAPIIIVNVVMFNGKANDSALSAAYALGSLIVLVIMANPVKEMLKSKKSAVNTAEAENVTE